MRATEHAPRDPFRVLERLHGLAEVVERGAGVLQYLVWHLTHRGAVWARGAAQAAQFVRIIWRGVECFQVAGGACFVSAPKE